MKAYVKRVILFILCLTVMTVSTIPVFAVDGDIHNVDNCSNCTTTHRTADNDQRDEDIETPSRGCGYHDISAWVDVGNPYIVLYVERCNNSPLVCYIDIYRLVQDRECRYCGMKAIRFVGVIGEYHSSYVHYNN